MGNNEIWVHNLPFNPLTPKQARLTILLCLTQDDFGLMIGWLNKRVSAKLA